MMEKKLAADEDEEVQQLAGLYHSMFVTANCQRGNE